MLLTKTNAAEETADSKCPQTSRKSSVSFTEKSTNLSSASQHCDEVKEKRRMQRRQQQAAPTRRSCRRVLQFLCHFCDNFNFDISHEPAGPRRAAAPTQQQHNNNNHLLTCDTDTHTHIRAWKRTNFYFSFLTAAAPPCAPFVARACRLHGCLLMMMVAISARMPPAAHAALALQRRVQGKIERCLRPRP